MVTVIVLRTQRSVTVSDCHYLMIFSVISPPQNCHCNQIVALTGVTVTGMDCITSHWT